MMARKLRDCKGAPGGEKLPHQTVGAANKAELDGADNARDKLRLKMNQVDNSTPLAYGSQVSMQPAQQHYPGILLQLTNNNFNDRIMTHSYNKYRKPKYPGLTGGLHQLQKLTSNAH